MHARIVDALVFLTSHRGAVLRPPGGAAGALCDEGLAVPAEGARRDKDVHTGTLGAGSDALPDRPWASPLAVELRLRFLC